MSQDISLPMISLTLSDFLDNSNVTINPSGKCARVVFNSLDILGLEAAEAAVEKLWFILKQIAHFVWVTSDLANEHLNSKHLNSPSTWIISKQGGAHTYLFLSNNRRYCSENLATM